LLDGVEAVIEVVAATVNLLWGLPLFGPAQKASKEGNSIRYSDQRNVERMLLAVGPKTEGDRGVVQSPTSQHSRSYRVLILAMG
jgi:hypothetical protein